MTDLTVIDRVHAEISPSKFEMVEACTMSAKLSAVAPREAPGPDALAGSAAHAVLETCLKEDLDTIELSDLQTVTVKDQAVPVDAGMLDGVQICIDYVRASPLLAGRPFEVEKVLHLDFAEQYLGKPMYGFADVVVSQLPVVVIDYKNGFNKVAASTAQAGLYILAEVLAITGGSLDQEGLAGTAVIVQPNVDDGKVSEHEWTFAALRDLRDRVIHTLQRLRRGDWSYQHGPWCRWCPAAALCPHLAAVARDFALTKVAPTPEMVASGELTASQLDEMYQTLQVLDGFSRSFMATYEDYLRHGGHSTVAKLVRKKTNRRWVNPDEGEVAGALAEQLRIDPWMQTLITPAEAERRAGDAQKPIIKELVEKPIGELTIAAIDDKREAIEVAAKLTAALASSVAAGYLESAKSRATRAEQVSHE